MCVTPAAAVRVSLTIVEFAVTVVLRLNARPASFASCSVPPLRVSPPVPNALALFVARRMPLLTIVLPA